jgi:hypothetical protein
MLHRRITYRHRRRLGITVNVSITHSNSCELLHIHTPFKIIDGHFVSQHDKIILQVVELGDQLLDAEI